MDTQFSYHRSLKMLSFLQGMFLASLSNSKWKSYMYSCLGLRFSSIGLHIFVIVVVWKWLGKCFCGWIKMVLGRFISFFFHCSDQTPERMQLKGGRAHFVAWLECTVHHSRGCTAVGLLGLWQQQPQPMFSCLGRTGSRQDRKQAVLGYESQHSRPAPFPPSDLLSTNWDLLPQPVTTFQTSTTGRGPIVLTHKPGEEHFTSNSSQKQTAAFVLHSPCHWRETGKSMLASQLESLTLVKPFCPLRSLPQWHGSQHLGISWCPSSSVIVLMVFWAVQWSHSAFPKQAYTRTRAHTYTHIHLCTVWHKMRHFLIQINRCCSPTW